MKWKNKGHEFDELGKIFEKNKDLLFLGDIDKAKKMKECLNFLGAKIFIAENTNLKDVDFNNKTILIFGNHCYIEEFIIQKGLRKNVEYFIISEFNTNDFSSYFNEFTKKYLSIFAIYGYDKVYIGDNNIVTTTVCNLNCKACLNYEPYIKNKKHNDFDRLKKDIDLYFKNVDMVGLLHITGGEPTLYKELPKFLKYINDNYRHKIVNLVMPTNCMVGISDELCETFKECNVIVQVDNYLEAVPQHKDIYENNIKKLNDYKINTEIIPAGINWNWCETYPPKYDYSKLPEEELMKRFDYCGCDFSEIRNGGLHVCNYQSYAETAGIIEEDKDSFFDLSGNVNKKELIEFRLKYNNKGYVEFCKSCNGLYPLNLDNIKAAQQTKGIIEWDGIFKECNDTPVDTLKTTNKIIQLEKQVNELTNKLDKLINKVAWFIPVRKWRDKFRNIINY